MEVIDLPAQTNSKTILMMRYVEAPPNVASAEAVAETQETQAAARVARLAAHAARGAKEPCQKTDSPSIK